MPAASAPYYGCTACRVRYPVPGATEGKTYRCPKCQKPLVRLAASSPAKGVVAMPTVANSPTRILADSKAGDAGGDGDLRIADEPPPIPHEIPVHISSYLIDGEIARGGMGVVYKARQKELNRVVAVKMMLSGAASDPEFVKRFHREAKAAARIHHPNIVAVYETGEYQGQPFIAMEYVDGTSLEREIKPGPMAPRRAAALLQSVAEAMHEAHRQGVIHRDLKPANILLTSDGTPKITDFGLARESGQSLLSVTGEIMGTPAFMSPEQARGQVHEIDARSDVYSLGAVLYACLTGKSPFHGNTIHDTLIKVTQEDPLPPERVTSGLDPDLGAICLKALEKDPERRYPTAAAFASDLGHWLAGETVSAKPMSRGRALKKALARNRRTVLVGGVLGGLLLVVLIAAPFVFRKSYLTVLKANLGSTDAEIRRTAFKTLAADLAGRKWESDAERAEATGLFLPGACDDDEAVSGIVLGYLKEHAGDEELRKAAAAKVVGPLCERLKAAKGEAARIAAIDVLGGLGAHDAVPVLLPLLRDPNAQVRLHAVRALGDIADRRALEPLLRAQVEDASVRADARMALQKLYANSTIVPFSPSDSAVKGALAGLGEKMADVQKQYEDLAAEEGQRGPLAPIDLAIQALKSASVEERLRAAYEIGTRLQDSKAVPALLDALGDPDRDVGRAAAEALVSLRAQGLAAEAQKRLKDASPSMRRGAADLCARIGEHSLADPLVLALGAEKDPSVRCALCEALAKTGDRASCSALVDALSDGDLAVRTSAAASLAALTGQDFGPDAAKWSAWLASQPPR